MEESTSSENIWCKSKTEQPSAFYDGEANTQTSEANTTSLADIFDTAFTSTVDPSPQSRFPSGNDMDYEHLFAESDIEDADVTPIDSYRNSTHRSTTETNFVSGRYLSTSESLGVSHEYWQHDRLNCNMCQSRQERSFKREAHKRHQNNSSDDKSCDLPIRHKAKKSKDQKNGQQSDSLSTAGPSRLSESSVTHRY